MNIHKELKTCWKKKEMPDLVEHWLILNLILSDFVMWDVCEKNNSWDISYWKAKVECFSTGKVERSLIYAPIELFYRVIFLISSTLFNTCTINESIQVDPKSFQ